MNFLKISSFFLLLSLVACFPNETPIPAVERVNLSHFVDAGEYKNIVTFYSLETSEVVAEADPMQWDLIVTEDAVKINYFRSLRIAKVNKEWHEVEDTVGLEFRFLTDDPYDGLNQWEIDTNQLYVIDYGLDYTSDFSPIGFQLLRIERVGESVRVWNTDIGVDYPVFTEVEGNSFYFNMRMKETVDLPMEEEYDLALGKYTEFITIDDESQDYNIYGVILGNSSAYLENQPFDSVDAVDFDSQELRTEKNVIGWDWKDFNLQNNAYTIEPNRTYMISSRAGFKYKLRFVSFYNKVGESGHTTFEYELL